MPLSLMLSPWKTVPCPRGRTPAMLRPSMVISLRLLPLGARDTPIRFRLKSRSLISGTRNMKTNAVPMLEPCSCPRQAASDPPRAALGVRLNPKVKRSLALDSRSARTTSLEVKEVWKNRNLTYKQSGKTSMGKVASEALVFTSLGKRSCSTRRNAVAFSCSSRFWFWPFALLLVLRLLATTRRKGSPRSQPMESVRPFRST
mmetsp:Transcript_53576/g.81301  ORF Transcript_53576/g.81301 Transcript_53576/m.81301 type:complete len:202 (-) Transcript_53576:831-1436(-)